MALWIASPGQWQRHDDAACKVDFWLRNLRLLSQALEALNIPLLVRTTDTWREVPQVLLEACREHQIGTVHWNEEYGVNETLRDSAARALLEQSGVATHTHLDQLLFKPGSVLTRGGQYFQVFSQFKRVCLEHLHRSLPARAQRPKRQAPLDIASDPIPEQIDGFAIPHNPCATIGRPGKKRPSGGCRASSTKPSKTTRNCATCPPRPAPASSRPTWRPASSRHANACTRHWPATTANSTAVTPVCRPG